MHNETNLKGKTGDGQDGSRKTISDPMKSLMPPIALDDTNAFTMSGMPKTLHWSIPWSDLMMTMFILLAILFVYTVSANDIDSTESKTAQSDFEDLTGKASAPRTQPEKVLTEIPELYKTSQQTLRADDLKDIASVELIEDKAVRIILTGDVFFDTGKADLKSEAISALQRITGMLKETPHIVNVVGHTDNVPIHTDRFPSNWELSTARACVTARFLIDEIGVVPGQIYVSGHAAYRPVESNDTTSGRLANRRVEIVITKEKPKRIKNTTL